MIKTYKFYWYKEQIILSEDNNHYKPPIREGCTLNVVSNKLFLYGGVSFDCFTEFSSYDFSILIYLQLILLK